MSRCDWCGEKECCGAVLGQKLKDLKEESERLRVIINKVGRHFPYHSIFCNYPTIDVGRCNCGRADINKFNGERKEVRDE